MHAPAPIKRSAEYRVYALLISRATTRIRIGCKGREFLRVSTSDMQSIIGSHAHFGGISMLSRRITAQSNYCDVFGIAPFPVPLRAHRAHYMAVMP